MSDIEQVVLDTLNSYDYIQSQSEFLNEMNSELDKLITDIYHIYAFGHIDAIEMMQISSCFRKKMKYRAEVKEDAQFAAQIFGVFKKHHDFFEELEYILKKVKREQKEYENKVYHAKSKFGQELIDKYSKNEDNLIKSPDHEVLEDLKGKLEMKNCG